MARFNLIVLELFAVFAVLSSVSNTAESIRPPFRKHPLKRLRELEPADNDRNYRLPNNTEPLHYDIELSTNVDKGEHEFSGIITIHVHVLEDTRTIVLHARQLTISAAKIQKESSGLSYPLNQAYDSELEFLSLTPQDTSLNFQAGEKWILTIHYNGLLSDYYTGFYMATYTDENNNKRYLATTQFESTEAREGFPCYDEPAKRATFTITINHDPSYHAISNMPVDSKSTAGRTVFQTTVNMPTYLVAFIVSDFKFSAGELNSLPQRVYSRSGTEHEQEWALVSGMLIIQRLAEYYGISFALPKLDQVAVPDFPFGGMENYGLVTYSEEYLLYNKDKTTVKSQTYITYTIAHEYAHQWFGNLVALKWWTYLWIKEGFATLFSYHATGEAYPEWDMYQMFHTDAYQYALNNDADLTSLPMTGQYVQTPDEIGDLYDDISYSKAAAVLSMWQHALSEAVFRQGLHNFLENNKFSAADESDLFKAFQDAAKELNFPIPATIEDMMSSWTHQGGYPLLTVTRNYEDGSFTVRQEAFYSNASQSGDHMWHIPINAAIQSNPDFRNTTATHYMLKVEEMQINDVKPSEEDWLILNKQSTGYYRINYDEQNWGLITKSLIHNPYKIHSRNRAQLMHDAYSFTFSNRLKHSILMELLTYLPREDQYAPWSTANSILTTLNRYLSGNAKYQDFKNYVAALVGNIYDRLGVNEDSGEQHFQKYVRPIAINLACMVGIDSCLQETNNKLIEMVEKGTEIEPNVMTQIFCNGLKQSADKEFNFVYNELMESDDPAKSRLLISSLGCAQKEEHIKKFIDSSIDMNNKLGTQERQFLLLSSYSRGEVGLYICIEFLKQNWKVYGGLIEDDKPLDNDIRFMSSFVFNKDQEKALLELVNMVKESEYVEKDLEQFVHSKINDNFVWLKDNGNEIMGWLANYYKNPIGGGSSMIHASLIGVTAIALLTRLL